MACIPSSLKNEYINVYNKTLSQYNLCHYMTDQPHKFQFGNIQAKIYGNWLLERLKIHMY